MAGWKTALIVCIFKKGTEYGNYRVFLHIIYIFSDNSKKTEEYNLLYLKNEAQMYFQKGRSRSVNVFYIK